MPISVTCDECSATHRVRDDAVGKRFKCKGCGSSLLIEAPALADHDSTKTPDDSAFEHDSRDLGEAERLESLPSGLSRVSSMWLMALVIVITPLAVATAYGCWLNWWVGNRSLAALLFIVLGLVLSLPFVFLAAERSSRQRRKDFARLIGEAEQLPPPRRSRLPLASRLWLTALMIVITPLAAFTDYLCWVFGREGMWSAAVPFILGFGVLLAIPFLILRADREGDT